MLLLTFMMGGMLFVFFSIVSGDEFKRFLFYPTGGAIFVLEQPWIQYLAAALAPFTLGIFGGGFLFDFFVLLLFPKKVREYLTLRGYAAHLSGEVVTGPLSKDSVSQHLDTPRTYIKNMIVSQLPGGRGSNRAAPSSKERALHRGILEQALQKGTVEKVRKAYKPVVHQFAYIALFGLFLYGMHLTTFSAFTPNGFEQRNIWNVRQRVMPYASFDKADLSYEIRMFQEKNSAEEVHGFYPTFTVTTRDTDTPDITFWSNKRGVRQKGLVQIATWFRENDIDIDVQPLELPNASFAALRMLTSIRPTVCWFRN